MLKINYDTLNSKTSHYSSLDIKEKYVLSNKIFNMVATTDKQSLESTLEKSGVKELFERAEVLVLSKAQQGMIIVPEPRKREITLVFSSIDNDVTGPFFEISKLAERMGSTNVEKLLILGFFMNEDKMNVIQAYNLLSNEISGLIND